jgi:RNA polymerase sigma factor (sigma-70 family)
VSFEAIYRRYHQALYRYCLAILGNPEDAQDALQNTMVKAMRALPGEKRKIDLKPWLYRVAHNESVDLLRKRRPAEEMDVELAAAGPGAAEAAETRERLRGLIDDLGELPDRQRGALVMRELSGLSFEQIGAAFDTSAAVARQTVYEARLSLREMEEGREMSCEHVMHTLSNADGRIVRRRDIRAHLRACPDCRAFREGIAGRRRDLAALAPLPAVASAGLFRGLLAGGGSASGAGAGAGVAGSVGAGAGKVVATSAVVKSAATVAVVAAVGIGAADRGGLIHVAPSGGGSPVTRDAAAAFPPLVGKPAGDPQSSPSPAAGRDATHKGQDATPGASPEKDSGTAAGAGTGDRASDVPANSPSVVPDKKPSSSLHGQKTSNGRNDEVAHQDRGSHGSAGTRRGAGSNGGRAQHSPPRQSGNGAQPGQLPGTGADVHTGGSKSNPGPESGAAGKGEGLRPLLPE